MRILVVDDHAPTIELMRLTLTSFGHSVTSATNVADALRLITEDCPDIVLSDLTFSGRSGSEQDGYALARTLRADPQHADVALLAITGINSPTELEAALKSGFDDVVVKPFTIPALLKRIDAFEA